jgi:tryptophan-rich sensory protein
MVTDMQNIVSANKGDWIGLVVSILICFAVAGLGSLATIPEIPNWYQTIKKPVWTPPNWLFGPVWTALYLAMAVAAWLVWKQAGWESNSSALWLFVIQLALNLAWSFIFFKFHSPAWALVDIVFLWLAILATAVKFAGVSIAAALLLVPYLIWVTYAASLNFAIWRMND